MNCSESAYIAATRAASYLAHRRGIRLQPVDLAEIVDAIVDRLPQDDWEKLVLSGARFAILNWLKAQRRTRTIGSAIDQVVDSSPDTLPRCYLQLASNRDRQLVALALSKGMSVNEIARALACRKQRVSNAKKGLQQDLAIFNPNRSGPLTVYIQRLYRTGRIEPGTSQVISR